MALTTTSTICLIFVVQSFIIFGSLLNRLAGLAVERVPRCQLLGSVWWLRTAKWKCRCEWKQIHVVQSSLASSSQYLIEYQDSDSFMALLILDLLRLHLHDKGLSVRPVPMHFSTRLFASRRRDAGTNWRSLQMWSMETFFRHTEISVVRIRLELNHQNSA